MTWRARIKEELTWLMILALPRARRNAVIDGAIRDVPGFMAMDIPTQDAAIADYFRRTYRR